MPLKTLIEHIGPVRAYLNTLRSIAHKISSHREIVSTHDYIETHTIQSPNCNQQKNVFDVNQQSAISSLLTKLIVLHVFTQAHTYTFVCYVILEGFISVVGGFPHAALIPRGKLPSHTSACSLNYEQNRGKITYTTMRVCENQMSGFVQFRFAQMSLWQ